MVKVLSGIAAGAAAVVVAAWFYLNYHQNKTTNDIDTNDPQPLSVVED